jgi:hypothetical protein
MSHTDLTTEKYIEVEEQFRTKLLNHLGDRVILYCITGSLNHKTIIPGWSDVDILLLIDKYDSHFFESLNECLNDNKSGIKIGTTFYSIKEYKRTDIFFDPKSQFSLELIKRGVYKPQIINERVVEILESNKNVIEWFDSVNLTRLLFDLKRGITSFLDANERSLYKCVITILKILVYREGIMSLSYEDTIRHSRNILSYPHLLPTPEDVAYNKTDYMERRDAYIDFIVWLENRLYA